MVVFFINKKTPKKTCFLKVQKLGYQGSFFGGETMFFSVLGLLEFDGALNFLKTKKLEPPK